MVLTYGDVNEMPTDTWETTVRTAATTMLRYPERICGRA